MAKIHCAGQQHNKEHIDVALISFYLHSLLRKKAQKNVKTVRHCDIVVGTMQSLPMK